MDKSMPESMMHKKTYLQWSLEILGSSEFPLTTGTVYQKAIDMGFVHNGSKSTALRKFRQALSRCAVNVPTPGGNLWLRKGMDWDARPAMTISEKYKSHEDHAPSALSVDKQKLLVKVIENLIEHDDIPEGIDRESLIRSMNAYKVGLIAKEKSQFDVEKFMDAFNGRIPDEWNLFNQLADAVLSEYQQIPETHRDICRIIQ